MSGVAFFPWVYLEEPLTVGDVRLIPFETVRRPGDLEQARQGQLDAVLKAYRSHPQTQRHRATLLEVGEWRTGMHVDEPTADRLFRIRTAVVFSALAARSLFKGHFGYTNTTAYQLVVQRYDPLEPSRFAFLTRRRDGAASHTWSAERFAFDRPHQVGARERFAVDLELLRALTSPALQPWLHEALLEFNGANTDSSDTPDYAELVMMKTALEWLLQVGDKWQDFARTLRALLPTQLAADGPLRATWAAKYGKAPDLIGAWAQEFCTMRNWSAHADPRDEHHFVWGVAQHLAFVATLIPLLVKRLLSVDGQYPLLDVDLLRAQRLSRLLVHDPMAHDWESDHPWLDVESDARMRALSFALQEQLVDLSV